MGRPPIDISLSVNLKLLGDMPDRMRAVQRQGETRSDFIRLAINNEIDRRWTKSSEAERNRTVQS